MPENLLYEYAVVRIMPRVEREEFINVGVVVYCAATKFLKAKIEIDIPRLRSFCHTCNIEETTDYLHAFERICRGLGDAGPISTLPASTRFRWLTATRSTIVQTSKVHPGMSVDPEATLEQLFEKMVG